jgi:hypothetical protein
MAPKRRCANVQLKDVRNLLWKKRNRKVSWENTYRACARERGDREELELTLADGIDDDAYTDPTALGSLS